jgi:hypothetical protein
MKGFHRHSYEDCPEVGAEGCGSQTNKETYKIVELRN